MSGQSAVAELRAVIVLASGHPGADVKAATRALADVIELAAAANAWLDLSLLASQEERRAARTRLARATAFFQSVQP